MSHSTDILIVELKDVNKNENVGFEVLMAVTMKSMVFCIVKPLQP
jgi:hypothetical protein